MNYLLDTQTFLWAAMRPARLASQVREILENSRFPVGVSVASFWEISLKYSLGKLQLTGVSPEELVHSAEEMQFAIEPLEIQDVATSFKLPRGEHKDPFDRIIAWQCIRRKWALVSTDVALECYRQHGLQLLLH